MPTIGKIIIAVALVYIATVLTIIDFNDLSWETNSQYYWKLFAAVVFIAIQFKLKSNTENQ
jgi:TRAP-type mannitol/chloroaromatic compound transport system permease small subunit